MRRSGSNFTSVLQLVQAMGVRGEGVELGGCVHGDNLIVVDSAVVHLTAGFLTQSSGESTESEWRGAGQENIKCLVALLMGHSLLICGGKLAELGDGGGDHVQGEINVRGGCVSAEAEAQAGAGFFRWQANGSEHV